MKLWIQVICTSIILMLCSGCDKISDGSAFAGPEFERVSLEVDENLNLNMEATIIEGFNLQSVKDAGFYYGTNLLQLNKESGVMVGRSIKLTAEAVDEGMEYYVKSYVTSGTYEIESAVTSIVVAR